jgi:hypothetical protein
MTLLIFIVGLIVSSAVVYALFAYTVHEMGTTNKDNRQKKQKAVGFNAYAPRKINLTSTAPIAVAGSTNEQPPNEIYRIQ